MKWQHQIIRQKQHNHKLLVSYNSCVMGPIIYLLSFVETGKYYVGWTPNFGDRVEGHFNHPYDNNKKKVITYHEGLKNKRVEVYTLASFSSVEEAKYKERLWIEEVSKIVGRDNLLNVVHNIGKKVA